MSTSVNESGQTSNGIEEVSRNEAATNSTEISNGAEASKSSSAEASPKKPSNKKETFQVGCKKSFMKNKTLFLI